MNFKKNIVSVAQILIPDLQHNKIMQDIFWQNFMYIYNDLDADSAQKIRLLSTVLNILCVLYYATSISSINQQKGEKFFKKIQSFPISKVSAGFTGLKSLILVSYYSTEQSWKNIQYEGPIVKKA